MTDDDRARMYATARAQRDAGLAQYRAQVELVRRMSPGPARDEAWRVAQMMGAGNAALPMAPTPEEPRPLPVARTVRRSWWRRALG